MIRVLRDRHARIMCWWGSVSDFFHKKSLEIRVTFSAMYSSPRSLSFAVLIWHSVGKRPWRNQASLNEPTQNILYPIQNSSIRTIGRGGGSTRTNFGSDFCPQNWIFECLKRKKRENEWFLKKVIVPKIAWKQVLKVSAITFSKIQLWTRWKKLIRLFILELGWT